MGIKCIFYAGALPYLDTHFLQETYDVLVGVDGGAKLLFENGYSLDYAIGDFDSANKVQAKQEVVLPCEKDDTDLQYALFYVLQRYSPEDIDSIVIYGAIGGHRLDHTLCNVWLINDTRFIPFIEKIKCVDAYNTMHFLLPGEHILSKEDDKVYLSFISVSPIHNLTLQHVKYPLQHVDLVDPVAYISNEFLDQTMVVSFDDGKLIVLQTKD